ncbi:MAG TPA: TfoX/Sxy family protein [Puia sp.]|nr:TfoX/Sxy family protein [Puia sp.]
MAYDEKLAGRVREALAHIRGIEEKKMFRGITFMVKGKMCVSVSGNELMCRVNPAQHDELLEKKGCREMIHGGKTMKGFIYVSPEGIKAKKDFEFWINLCLEFNKKAKASKKRS